MAGQEQLIPPMVAVMVIAVVREWDEYEGWGVLDSPETPGGCFAHFSNIDAPGYRALETGAQVELEWEAPGFKQDGYDYRAVRVVSPSAPRRKKDRR